MSRAAGLRGGVFVFCWAVAACTNTTGDPRQGGLFGWSETKAKDRQHERQAGVASAETELNRENTQTRHLEAAGARTDRQLAAAQLENARAEEKLRAQQDALLGKIDRLESESPTPASASRARTYRRKVTTIAAQTALPTAQRSARLRTLEAEIDGALEQLKR